jgi:hypothetical protein
MVIKYRKAPLILLFIGIIVGFAAQTLSEEIARENSNTTHFTFKKHGKLISLPSNMHEPGPYYTCLVKMKDVKNFPYDYILYFSTDHDDGKGGIWMYVCNGLPTVANNWKSYDQAVAEGDFDYLPNKPLRNPIFIDTVQGSQTETPHANVLDGIVYMTYHNVGAGRNQSTLLATSQDGVNFSRINGNKDSVILDYIGEPGDGHTGYFRWGPNPFSGVKYKYVGYSLYGGGYDYHSAMWTSNNAIDWEELEVLTPKEGFAMEEEYLLIWHEIDPNSVVSLGNGEYIAICAGGNRAFGAMPRVVELYEIFLANDGRTLTRKCRKIVAQGADGSDDAEEVAEPTTVVIGDTWHLIYVGTKEQGSSNTVMAASGKFSTIVPESSALNSAPILLLLRK